MRLLVCGGRTYNNGKRVREHLERLAPTTVIIGGARGADELARIAAQGLRVPVIVYNAERSKHGRAAGPLRNQQMLDRGKPDCVLAFTGGAGTADMVRRAKAAGIKVIEVPDAD